MMRRNIPLVLLTLLALLLKMNDAVAQERSYEGDIAILPVRVEQLGEFLHIDIDFVLNDVKVKSMKGVDFIPQLISPATVLNLPKLSLKGRNEYMVHERRLAAMSMKEKKSYEKPYLVEKSRRRMTDTLRYRYTLRYEPWMADAKLDIQRDECGCGESALMDVEHVVDKIILARMPVPYVVTPYLTYVEPMVEEIKSRDVQAECFLDFEVNKVNIRPEYMNNPQELAKICAMIDDLKSDGSIKVKRLDIIGYASPEGPLATNKRLSEGRAMALRDYLAARYDFPRNLYHIVFGGENWEGLVKVMETAEMDGKAEILDIIEHISIERGRETKLMQLRGGGPYKYLLEHVFPDLRVAICKVDYDIKDFDLDEAKEMIKIRPQNLSLNEMFMVANTHQKGSQEFIDIFETAVRIYPESEIANMNAATAAISRNDLITAVRYLNKVKSEEFLPEYNNAMGVLSLLQGDYELSEKYLKVAEGLGVEAAESNLEELAKKKASVAEMEKKNK